jgi:hypothetical protein
MCGSAFQFSISPEPTQSFGALQICLFLCS